MTTKTTASIAAGCLSLGILVGAAGTIVVRDATTTDIASHMSAAGLAGMMGGGSMMGGAGSMMGGAGSMMGGAGSMMGGTDSTLTPQDHAAHHAAPTPGATR